MSASSQFTIVTPLVPAQQLSCYIEKHYRQIKFISAKIGKDLYLTSHTFEDNMIVLRKYFSYLRSGSLGQKPSLSVIVDLSLSFISIRLNHRKYYCDEWPTVLMLPCECTLSGCVRATCLVEVSAGCQHPNWDLLWRLDEVIFERPFVQHMLITTSPASPTLPGTQWCSEKLAGAQTVCCIVRKPRSEIFEADCLMDGFEVFV